MPKFFVEKEQIQGDRLTIYDADVLHITKVLRHAVGDTLCVCDGCALDYICEITAIEKTSIVCKILQVQHNACEPSVQLVLLQALPKGDKMDLIVQKAVELGVHTIIPFESARCVVRLDHKARKKKQEKWQRICLEAAKQCNRGMIPIVADIVDFQTALGRAKACEQAVFLYENETGRTLRESVFENSARIALMVGPEGGFDEGEVANANAHGIPAVTLGKRILRLETASISAMSVVMFITHNL